MVIALTRITCSEHMQTVNAFYEMNSYEICRECGGGREREWGGWNKL